MCCHLATIPFTEQNAISQVGKKAKHWRGSCPSLDWAKAMDVRELQKVRTWSQSSVKSDNSCFWWCWLRRPIIKSLVFFFFFFDGKRKLLYYNQCHWISKWFLVEGILMYEHLKLESQLAGSEKKMSSLYPSSVAKMLWTQGRMSRDPSFPSLCLLPDHLIGNLRVVETRLIGLEVEWYENNNDQKSLYSYSTF